MSKPDTNNSTSYSEDVEFLKKHTDVIELNDNSGKVRIALAPSIQGRVMTSTVSGGEGKGFGWINKKLLASGQPVKHINAFGGEDRFWIGPEGGQFSIFFKKDEPFDLAHWQTPEPIDTAAYEVAAKTRIKAVFTKKFKLTNYSGFKFDLDLNRTVQLLPAETAFEHLEIRPDPALRLVAFQTVNQLTNAGTTPWNKSTGLLSIWILGMFKHSPVTTVVIPIVAGNAPALGPEVTSDYFGPLPSDRIQVKHGAVFFKADGQYRSKIGISPARTKPVIGSYDPSSGTLTIVQFSYNKEAKDYVNSLWELQKDPYAGDVINSYNDGAPEPGAEQLGPFYEIETSSAVHELKPGGKLEHTHRTIHITGDNAAIDKVARKVLGVSLEQIQSAL